LAADGTPGTSTRIDISAMTAVRPRTSGRFHLVPSATTANIVQNTASQVQLNGQSGYPDTTKPQLNQNQFGGTFGGPIKKDRTFFFLSYEGRRIRDGVPGQLLNVPTTAQFGGDFSGVGGFAPPVAAGAPGGPSAYSGIQPT